MSFHDISSSVKLNTGATMPMIGLGAWTGLDPEDVKVAWRWLATALKAGYRHIDTSLIYETEASVNAAIKASRIPRSELFITTKFPWYGHGRVRECFEQSLENLGTDYVDMYLMHWPQHVVYEEGNPLPRNPDGTLRTTEDVTFPQSYAVLESLLDSGRCKAIGVSNFSIKTLEELFKTCKVTPAVNQVEIHPYLVQEELVQYCQAKGIVVVAYTPTGKASVRNDPVIGEIATKYNATPTQIILAWHFARGVAVVPKSADEGRQKENLKLPVLEPADVKKISALDRNDRLSNKEWEVNGNIWGWTYEQLGWE